MMTKIVCIGDSLTYGYMVRRSEVWTRLLEKKYDIKVLNKGISGDSTGGMLARFYRDVIDHNPSFVLIMGGSNDFIMRVPLSIVCSNIAAMVHQAQGNNIIPIIATPLGIESEMAEKHWSEVTDFSRVNEDLQRYREWMKKFGRTFNIPVIDFFKEFSDAIEGKNKVEYYLDGLHPTPQGHEIMIDVIKIEKIIQRYNKNGYNE
ncbi:SGNH/GDSL hydrolase family protein [Clostridiaceae bacterium 35-E11]